MKSSFRLLLIGIIATPFAWAQEAPLLLENNKTWSCYGDFFYNNVKYQIGADTVIGSTSYSKVMAVSSGLPFSFEALHSHYKSALRESAGKVWVVEKNFTTEHLLYDFTKQTGDTIRFYRPIGDFNNGILPNHVIGKIYKTDFVVLGGISRKRIFIHEPSIVNMVPVQAQGQLDSQADIWIEGIGSRTGLFQRMPPWGVVGPQPYLLACVEIEGQIIYQFNTGYNAHPDDPCFIIPPGGTTPEEEDSTNNNGGNDSLVLESSWRKAKMSPILFPNPLNGNDLNLLNVEDGPITVVIVNAMGIPVGRYISESISGRAQIRFEGQATGTYVCISERFNKPVRFTYFKE